MFIKVDKTNYFVNPDKYNGTERNIIDQIVEEVISRMDMSEITSNEREKLRIKIHNRYIEAKNKDLPFY